MFANYKQMPNQLSFKKILLLSFLEGAIVMMVELLGGKMLVPYFGNSLIIWTSTIGVTMSSLVIGYFLGGYLSSKSNLLYVLKLLLSLVAVWIVSMPLLAKAIQLLNFDSLYLSSVVSVSFLMSFPLILLGSTPPILIGLLTKDSAAGKMSGRVFSISTIGGIFCALALGFVVIEPFGVKVPLVLFGFVFYFTLLYVFRGGDDFTLTILTLAPLLFFGVMSFRSISNNGSVLYYSESLQGQLKVVDEPQNGVRALQINGVSQTRTVINYSDPSQNLSKWWYVHFHGALASHKPKGSSVLILGFGGGGIAQEMLNLGFVVDVVEFDHRLPAVSEEFFLFDINKVNVYIDDARHFIKNKVSNKKYDLIVIDVCHGEVQPNHILTKEGLTELKDLLNPYGVVQVSFQSNFDEEQKPFLSILNTLWASGYDAVVNMPLPVPLADFIFIASPDKLPSHFFDVQHMNKCCEQNRIVSSYRENMAFITKNKVPESELLNAKVFVDDAPVLEIMNQQSVKKWRENMLISY